MDPNRNGAPSYRRNNDFEQDTQEFTTITSSGSDFTKIEIGTLPISFYLLDDALNAVWVNASCHSLHRNVVLPKAMSEFLHAEDGRLVQTALERPVDIRLVDDRGASRWCELRIMPVTPNGGVSRCAMLIDVEGRYADVERERSLRGELRHRLRNLR